MRPAPWSPLLFLGLSACLFGGTGSDEPPTPSGRSDTGSGAFSCGDEIPVIQSFTATPEGLGSPERNGEEYPLLGLDFTATDADGALGEVVYRLWFDDHVDGFVDTSGDPFHAIGKTLSLQSCVTTEAQVHVTVTASGQLAPNTWYDFAVTVEDRDQHVSAPAYTSGGTPKDDGSDPDPLER